MPNNPAYSNEYNLNGKVTFTANNVTVPVTELHPCTCGNKTLTPNYERQSAAPGLYVINRNLSFDNNPEGSVFVPNLREVHPFEAYLTVEGAAAAKRMIPIFDDGEQTGILHLSLKQDHSNDEWYSVDGRKLPSQPTAKGLYIRNGQKVAVKR